MRAISRLYLKVFGWRFEGGRPPELDRSVVICAPHTSNWDLPFALAFAFTVRFKPRWMVKNNIFIGPIGWVLKWLGGIPIDRSKAHNIVEAYVLAFKEFECFTLGITPEATRSKVDAWKTGFYHIAKMAGVPVLTGYLDFKRKVGGFGPVIIPSGDIEADMAVIRNFYATITGKLPENYEPAWGIAKPRQ